MTRETTAVFPVILALIPLPRSRLRAGWGLSFLTISLLPFLLYRVALTIWLQGRGNIAPFEPIPFLGILRYWPWSNRTTCALIHQYKKYRCAIGSTSAGAQVSSSPSARTS